MAPFVFAEIMTAAKTNKTGDDNKLTELLA
jgi:hypothetical protein